MCHRPGMQHLQISREMHTKYLPLTTKGEMTWKSYDKWIDNIKKDLNYLKHGGIAL